MTRRAFVPAALAATSVSSAADTPKPMLIDLRRYQLRNSPDNQRQRTTDFLRQQASALQRAGAGGLGAFASSIAPHTPFLLTIASYSSFAAMDDVLTRLGADSEYRKALEAFDAQPGLN